MTEHKHLPTVLYAEDDDDVRSYVCDVLTANGMKVYEASNGQEAIEIYKERGGFIDVILSDMRMPLLDGGALANYNYINRNIPFIIYTAFADAKSAIELLSVGVYDYLTKPVREKILVGVIKNALFRRSLSAEVPLDENPYAGNVGEITIPSKTHELKRANSWIKSHLVKNYLDRLDIDNFIVHINELLLNAYEHGNFKMTEAKKSELINQNEYSSYLKGLDEKHAGKIEISVSVLKNEVAIRIADEGSGFDTGKYLNMAENEILNRIDLPNGRGILMSQKFFDSITYTNNGACVLVTKKIAP